MNIFPEIFKAIGKGYQGKEGCRNRAREEGSNTFQ